MKNSNTIAVIVIIVACGVLVFALAFWLDPEKPQTNELIEEYTSDEVTVPLTVEEIAIYNVDMTNDKNPVAEVKTTLGTFELELFEDTMPVTAGNFIELIESGYYDGIKFHRIIENFMIQGGDPITKTDEVLRYGTGGPGYSIPDEHVAGEFLTNVRGTISMANSGPNSGGSQFFINVADNTNLDFDKQPLSSKHPVFGRILSGMDVVQKMSTIETNERDAPLEPIVIESITIKSK
jgi:peptidylprolyl isomerase